VPNIVWEVCGLPLPEWTQKRGSRCSVART
jgi:hypothetical protein